MYRNILLIILLIATYSYGTFNVINPSPRPLGMGNAFVAVADDINTLYLNPAGLTNLKTWQILFTYSKLYWGVSDLSENFIVGGVSLKEYGSLGVGWYNFNEPSYYKESIISIGLAYPINGLLPSLSVGINVKLLNRSYISNVWTSENPYFKDGLSKSGISFGTSVYAGIIKELSFGLFIDDINTPNMALSGEEKVPMVIRSGFRYSFDKNNFATVEFLHRDNQYKIHFGGESSQYKTGDFGILSFRIGGGAGSDSYLNFTLGLGYKFNIPYINIGGEFDYGFLFPIGFASGTAGTHKFSLSIMDFHKELMKGVEEVK